MNYRIQLWCEDCFLGLHVNVPIPRVGDLVRICNTKFHKVKAVSFTYNNGYETDSCVVDVYLIEVKE